jgi:hypothetical protein
VWVAGVVGVVARLPIHLAVASDSQCGRRLAYTPTATTMCMRQHVTLELYEE